jgi:hypothetical protein
MLKRHSPQVPHLDAGRRGDAWRAASWTSPPMTSADTTRKRVIGEIPELTTVPGGGEIRYAVADLKAGTNRARLHAPNGR